MDSFLKEIKNNSNVAIFSTSIIAKYLFENISKKRPDINVICFIDSTKTGLFEGVKIVNPQDAAQNKQIDIFIIASASNAKLLENILLSYGSVSTLTLSENAIKEINDQIVKDAGNTFKKDLGKERYPLGHYYSAVPSTQDINEALSLKEFDEKQLKFEGIELNLDYQLENLKYFEDVYDKIKIPQDKTEEKLYYLNNIWFHPYDAYCLFGIILKNKPKKIIEIGSGYSSGLMLDINKEFFENKINLTCIEPNPKRLKEVLGKRIEQIKIQEKRLQDTDLSIFSELEENDVLFVDSSHVAKISSDVLKIFFEILPKLNKGVIVHFHDIFNNFSYPKEWLVQRRCWNEAFMLRAFLMYNQNFKIEFYSDFIKAYLRENNIETKLPINQGSGSIYIRKL